MHNISEHSIYEFGEFVLDADRLMLYRDEAEISLPPKVIKTLSVLVENRGDILSKDELMERVWEGSIVEESNLSQYLYLLRKTVGNKPDGNPYIETLRRRGYRFNGDVRIPSARNIAKQIADRDHLITRSERFNVERRGNVLALVDWRETEPSSVPEAAPALETAGRVPIRRRSSAGLFLAVATGAAGVALLAAVGSWFWTDDRSHDSLGAADLNIRRLTNENYVHDATISRDGNYFAYSEPADGTSRIWIQQTGQAARVEIVPAQKWSHANKTFSPDGRFLFFTAWTDGENPSLYRVPTLGGTPEKVLSDVNSWVSFSPDGKEMIFLRREEGGLAFFIAPSSGKSSERRVLGAESGLFIHTAPAWSPDARRVAFAATEGPSPSIRLYTLDLESGTTRALSEEAWGNCYRIEWLRDGSAFAMIGTRNGETLSTRRDQVYLISYPDGRSRRLTTDGSRHEPGSLGVTDDGSIVAVSFDRASQIWSIDAGGDSRTAVQLTTGVGEGRGGIAALPDGRVGYVVLGEEGVSLWTINADGSGKKRLLPESHMEMLGATPDGQYFVFEDKAGEYEHLYRVATDGGEPLPLTSDETDTSNKDYLSVSPDGLWVAYDSSVIKDGNFTTSIKKVPVGGGEPVTLLDNGCRSPEYSPDGLYIACVSDDGGFEIRSTSDNSLIAKFEKVSYAYFEPKWAPDGQSLVYIVSRNNVCNLWKQPVNGGKPEPLTDFTSGQCHNFAYSRDGTHIYLARGYEARDAILIAFNKN